MFPRLHHSKESQTFPINSLVSPGCMTRKWGAFSPTSWGERGSDFVQRETPGARDTFNSTFLGIGHESKKWWITGQDTLMHSPSSNSSYHQDDDLQSVENPPKSLHKEGIYNRIWWPSLPSTRPFRSFLSYFTDSGKRNGDGDFQRMPLVACQLQTAFRHWLRKWRGSVPPWSLRTVENRCVDQDVFLSIQNVPCWSCFLSSMQWWL